MLAGERNAKLKGCITELISPVSTTANLIRLKSNFVFRLGLGSLIL